MSSTTNREITVDYLANLGEAARCRVIIPAGTRVAQVEGGMGPFWAVDDIALLARLTGNTHDPIYRYCVVPADCVSL